MVSKEQTGPPVEVVMPEIVVGDQVGQVTRAEIDVGIATAHAYPRVLARFHREMRDLVAGDHEFCLMSYYSLERGGKLIQGESIRFAEALLWSWGNASVVARYVGESADRRMVIVQAVGMDLERGVRVGEEVVRRITDRDGRRYSDDMVAVTIRAATAIARREVILQLVPRLFYREHFEAALNRVLAGATLEERLAALKERGAAMGLTREWVLAQVKKSALSELTPRDFLHIWGILNAKEDSWVSGNGGGDAKPAAPTASDIAAAAGGSSEPNNNNPAAPAAKEGE